MHSEKKQNRRKPAAQSQRVYRHRKMTTIARLPTKAKSVKIGGAGPGAYNRPKRSGLPGQPKGKIRESG